MAIYNVGHNGIPKRVKNQLPFGVRQMRYGKHAMKESRKDRYGNVQLPNAVDMSTVEVVEVETENNVLTKVIFRLPQDNDNHAVYVVIPERGGLFVKTTWINRATDNHSTLKRERFV